MVINTKLTRPNALPPEYKRRGDSGADLYSCISLLLPPGARDLIPTGVSLEIPEGYEAQVRSRSGLAIKYGLFVLNSPGTIDSNFRGEIQVIVYNASFADIEISEGDRIAQLVIQAVERATFFPSVELENTERNEQGFGSSGV